MQRPKQQALAFLLGALLVGGVVGFSADRVFRRDETTLASRRAALYDDLDLDTKQRAAIDSLLDDRNCQLDAMFKPLQPSLDSVKVATRAHMDRLLTPEQRTRLDARRREDDRKKDAEKKRIQAVCKR
jgi:hypothetical protein